MDVMFRKKLANSSYGPVSVRHRNGPMPMHHWPDNYIAVNSTLKLMLNFNGRTVDELLTWCEKRWGPEMQMPPNPQWTHITNMNIIRIPESNQIDDSDFVEFKLTWC